MLNLLKMKQHPLVVKANLIVADFYNAREQNSLFDPHFYAKCGLMLSNQLVNSNQEMTGIDVRKVFDTINNISMMIKTQQLRIIASRMEKSCNY